MRPGAHDTVAVRAGLVEDPAHGAVMPPLVLSSNFVFPGLGATPPYDYTRSGNPTRVQLTTALARLEGGAGAVATSSGMSAILVVLHLLESSDRILATHDCYGGTHRLFSSWKQSGRLQVEFVDFGNGEEVDRAFADRPALVWIETPSNPLLRITDLAAVSQRCRAAGALLAVDNTFLSPALQRPIDQGADYVVHSTTKLINGHSDAVGGAVVAASAQGAQDLEWWANCIGVNQSPFDAYQTMRGLRTLGSRIRTHQRNAALVVRLLARHPAVTRVHYPGLVSHPGHSVAAVQQRGFGSLVSFEVHGGLEGASRVVDALSVFTLAESLGGVESLVCHPATMTHAAMPPTARVRAGITEGLLRLSVGIEDPSDLTWDLERALDPLWPRSAVGPGATGHGTAEVP